MDLCLLAEKIVMQKGVVILITVAGVLISALLIIFLIFRTKNERNNFQEQKLSGNKLTRENFDSLIERRLKFASSKPKFSIFVIVITNYKSLLDVYGENHYYIAVKKLMHKISQIFDNNNKICLYNSDEINILQDNLINEKDIFNISNIMLDELTKPLQLIAGVTFHFNINIAAIVNDELNNNLETINKNAELAMIQSVKSGNNKFIMFSHSLSLANSDEIKYFKEVKQAINNNEFVLCYQPMVSLKNSEVFGYESLIRWNHKTLGMLAPSKFLKILEESNNMGWLFNWELETMLSSYKKLKTIAKKDIILSMNLSQSQLLNDKLFDDLKNVSRKFDVPCSQICFEIMEFNLYEKNEVVKSNINKISDAGFKIAIDNYGLELNTLNILNKMKVDILKLDKEFVNNFDSENFNEKIIAMLGDYAEKSKIIMVAIGIESKKTVDKLQELGVKYGQGFFYGMPKIISEMI